MTDHSKEEQPPHQRQVYAWFPNWESVNHEFNCDSVYHCTKCGGDNYGEYWLHHAKCIVCDNPRAEISGVDLVGLGEKLGERQQLIMQLHADLDALKAELHRLRHGLEMKR